VWLYEFEGKRMQRLTFDPGWDGSPVWSPDGRQIAFSAERNGSVQIYRKDAAGAGQEERLTDGPNRKKTLDWSRDGRYLLYQEQHPQSRADLWVLPLEGDRKPVLFLGTSFAEDAGRFSPDRKWIAYNSNQTGGYNVQVRAFPASAGQWQASGQGGLGPLWRGDGKELFYRMGAFGGPNLRLFAAGVRAAAGRIEIDASRELFQLGPSDGFDVSSDGQRFLMLLAPETNEEEAGALMVVSNWQASLKP